MKATCIFMLCFFSLLIYGQDTVRLISCYEKAIQYYPVSRDKKLNEQLSELKIKNYAAAWYPQVSLGAQASYQSDVTHLDVNLPFPGVSFPLPPKDQYKLTLDLTQTIFDGGYVKSQKSLENVSQLTESQLVEIELYQLKDRINVVYFSIALIDANVRLIQAAKKTIDENLKALESAIRNGVLTNPDKDILLAESLKFEEKLFELHEDRETAIHSLSDLTGEKYHEMQKFELPAIMIPDTSEGIRPEMRLYDLQMKKVDASMKVLDSRNMPKMSFFSQVGFGNPGLNMLSDKFAGYYILGASLKWTFWDWNTNKRDKEVLQIQKNIIADKKSVFELNRSIALTTEFSRIQKYQKSVDMNIRLVELRKNIARSSSAKLSSGTITSSDYVADVNAQIQAEMNMELSRISLIQSVVSYANIKGDQ